MLSCFYSLSVRRFVYALFLLTAAFSGRLAAVEPTLPQEETVQSPSVGLEEAAWFRPCPCTQQEAEFWMIDAREAPQCGDFASGVGDLKFNRVDEKDCVTPSTADEFFASDVPNRPTFFFVHGNRTDAPDALFESRPVYNYLSCNAKVKPFRFVLLSWPSDRIGKRPRPDAQTKDAYTAAESYYLASCLQKVRSDVPVHLIGYSLGSKIIAGSMHLLAGGEIDGQSLPTASSMDPKTSVERYQVTMFAPAMENYAMAPGGRFENAVSRMKSLVMTRNGNDRVLKWYPRLYGKGGPEAMGYVGPCGIVEKDRVCVLDVSCSVNRTHAWEFYWRRGNVGPYLLRNASSPEPNKVAVDVEQPHAAP